MSDSGIIGNYSVYENSNWNSDLSENIKEKLNKETQDILKKCLNEVEDLLKKEWKITEHIANELLAKEELEYDEIDAIFKDYGKVQTKP
jgi:ATP-dependent Zn protease